MKLQTVRILTQRETLRSENMPWEMIKTDELIEMPEDDLLMSILHRIITGMREEGEKLCRQKEKS